MRNVLLADALALLSSAENVFVRLALSRNDTGHWGLRSLVVEVLPRIWLDNHDIALLAPWMADQRLFESRNGYAFFFCDLVKSSEVRAWFAHPEDCTLRGFDIRPGQLSRTVLFTLPEFHDNVSECHLESHSLAGAKPIPYPSKYLSLTPKDMRYPNSRDDDRLIGEGGETFPSFRLARAELFFGVTSRNLAYQRNDVFAFRVVNAHGWLNEVRVLTDKLSVTLGGTEIIGKSYVVLEGEGLSRREPERPVLSYQVQRELPSHLPDVVQVVLLNGETTLDEVEFTSARYAMPHKSPQVVVEREDVFGYVPPTKEETMPENVCKAMTATGEPCRRKPSPSGNCAQHDPQKVKEREDAQRRKQEEEETQRAKGEELREVLAVIKATCRAKGWRFMLDHQDSRTWRHATISVERAVPRDGLYIDTCAVIDVTMDNGVRLSGKRTSGPNVGFDDLMESIQSGLHSVPWLEPAERALSARDDKDRIGELLQLLRRFHRVVRQLLDRHDHRPTLEIGDEYDVQDLLHALLRGHFDDVRPEETTPSYAGGRSRLDFLLKKEQIVIEVKHATERLKDREIGEQLIIDIARYRAHPDCKTLVCFVYDPKGQVANADGLVSDLSGIRDHMDVRVIVCPRGH